MANKNLFNSIKLDRPKNNVFDLSHDVKLSFNMGQLIPIMIQETVPGDKFNISCESLIRFAPLVAPVMHAMYATMHYFFVPNRILWEGWEKWIVQDETAPAFPTLTMNSTTYTQLYDYMGIPTPIDPEEEIVSALPVAAYQKIYQEYYRDQNLIGNVFTGLQNGSNDADTNLPVLRNRAWEHDYFTAALPFAQKGDPVQIPVLQNFDDVNVFRAGPNPPGGATSLDGTPVDQTVFITDPVGSNVATDALFAQTSELNPAQPTTINDLRRAFRIQEWLERNARGGTRYVENILAHFGVRSSDQRLQRPEYITGTRSPVVISEILNTTGTEALPQGNMAGHGVAVTSGKYANYRCEEHGYIIGIMSVLPKTCYQQGIERHWTKTDDPFQYYWPAFAHIGEQEVQNREIYAYQGGDSATTFGYVPRYAEYKYAPSRVAGDFRETLDFWHLGRKFATPPALNAAFVTADPTHRVFAVEDPAEQKMYAHVYNKIRAVRPMPKFGNPTF